MAGRRNEKQQKYIIKIIESGQVQKCEERAFTTLSGEVLDEKTRLRREYMKIRSFFNEITRDALDFKTDIHVTKFLRSLSTEIEEAAEGYSMILERIIVLLNMYNDMEISFYTAYAELLNQELLGNSKDLIEKHSFEEVMNQLIREEIKSNKQILNDEYNKEKVLNIEDYNNQLKTRTNKLYLIANYEFDSEEAALQSGEINNLLMDINQAINSKLYDPKDIEKLINLIEVFLEISDSDIIPSEMLERHSLDEWYDIIIQNDLDSIVAIIQGKGYSKGV